MPVNSKRKLPLKRQRISKPSLKLLPSIPFTEAKRAVTHWKKQLLEALPEIFANQRNASDKANAQLVDELYRQIGQLKVELDWLKKKAALNG